MSFKITIEQTKEVTTFTEKQWVQVDTKEVEREEKYRAAAANEPLTRISAVFDYTPQVETRTIVSKVIYTQELTELDVANVIAAVNGMN